MSDATSTELDTFVEDDPFESAEPAAPGSMLANLREQTEAREEQAHLDRKVPGLNNPPIFVRFKRVDFKRAVEVMRKTEKTNNAEAIAIANASILVDACVGVFFVHPDTGEEIGVDPESPDDWPRFDKRLAAILAKPGENLDRATKVCRALYGNDTPISEASEAVIEWSRTMGEDLERDPGN